MFMFLVCFLTHLKCIRMYFNIWSFQYLRVIFFRLLFLIVLNQHALFFYLFCDFFSVLAAKPRVSCMTVNASFTEPHSRLLCCEFWPWTTCFFETSRMPIFAAWTCISPEWIATSATPCRGNLGFTLNRWITAMVLYESCPVVRVQEACSPPRTKAETSKVSLPISSSLQFAIYSSSQAPSGQAPSSQAPSSPALESHSAQPFTSVLDSPPVTLPPSGASVPTGPKGAQG